MSISPGSFAPETTAAPQPKAYSVPAEPPSGTGRKIPVLFGFVIALIAANIYLFYELNQVKSDLTKKNDALAAELDKVKEEDSITAQSSRRNVQALQGQLENARRQARMAVGEAKTEALKKVDETADQLRAAQVEAQKQVESHISEVKQSADTANTKVAEVNTEVTSVKSDLGATKGQLEKTIADLKRTNGDLDGHSVLIATNAKELSALRALGERNYVEFSITKSKQPQKVGEVFVKLEKADPKHNRYSIELTADDKKVEKKDRTVNEPLQFLTSKSKQPYEIVVNDVKKDQIAGYLAIPKVLNAR
jgi:chromosome segregation ATPase